MLTWWDLGYALSDATDFATFHDGGQQFTPKTYFIARSLISPDPVELSQITRFIATEGNRGITENNTSQQALLDAVRNPKSLPWDPIYLFFTADMVGKYGAMTRIGNWKLGEGGSSQKGFQRLACKSIQVVKMKCQKMLIDLKL